MSYFPAFLKLDDKKIAIIGGGNIAFEKLTKLLDFTRDIIIISKEISCDIEELSKKCNLKIRKKLYEAGDIDGFDIVVIAVNDIALQKKIYDEAKSKHILCNAVDSVKYCNFIFPSYIKSGDLTICVSTSGASPAIAKHLRRFIQNLLPKDIDIFLKEMKKLRTSLPKGKGRMNLLDSKVKEYFKNKDKH
jgi:precorrin-2 dehydrogenase/sirohydrochlorin ferrochelatase